jgi:hypothetical protein
LAIRSTIFGVFVAASLLGAASAQAQSPSSVVGPYDGQIPFRCELQNVGTGTDFPHPEADPFCVEFDKTSQNVTDFGIVDFTAQEPARVAAAGNKCFYFQRDHWTGSIQQGQSPEIWHWDGDYWFDRARGVGGVSVRNYRIGGQPQSATPFVPEAYKPYFDENGGGGVEVLLDSDPDPSCGAKVDTPEERNEVYGDRPVEQGCIEPGGRIRGAAIGRAHLGTTRDWVREHQLGPPTYARHRLDAWCLVGKGELRVAYGSNGRSAAILTSGRGQSFHGVARGDRLERARRRLRLEPVDRRGGGRSFLVQHGGKRRVYLGVRNGRVRWVALLATKRTTPALVDALTRRVP